MNPKISIFQDDLKDGQIARLLELHRQEMFKHSPSDSVHALDAHSLSSNDLTFWRAEIDGHFAGCGALKQLSKTHGELKSMKTADAFTRNGIARKLLQVIIEEARSRGYQELSLETGSMAAFVPAKNLYASFGFEECEPFGEYFEDVNSVCMSMDIKLR